MPDILAYGDDALIARLGPARAASTHAKMHAVMHALNQQTIWREIMPGYDSVTVQFDPMMIDSAAARAHFASALSAKKQTQITRAPLELPICYDAPHALDLSSAANSLGLSESELIFRHSDPVYTVVFQGFMPGFSFCSAVDKKLDIPRHDNPRLSVPAGSVGIANWQTGLYGLTSPGGWQILGATPLTLFDPNREDAFLLSAGQQIKFMPVSTAEFTRLKRGGA